MRVLTFKPHFITQCAHFYCILLICLIGVAAAAAEFACFIQWKIVCKNGTEGKQFDTFSCICKFAFANEANGPFSWVSLFAHSMCLPRLMFQSEFCTFIILNTLKTRMKFEDWEKFTGKLINRLWLDKIWWNFLRGRRFSSCWHF